MEKCIQEMATQVFLLIILTFFSIPRFCKPQEFGTVPDENNVNLKFADYTQNIVDLESTGRRSITDEPYEAAEEHDFNTSEQMTIDSPTYNPSDNPNDIERTSLNSFGNIERVDRIKSTKLSNSSKKHSYYNQTEQATEKYEYNYSEKYDVTVSPITNTTDPFQSVTQSTAPRHKYYVDIVITKTLITADPISHTSQVEDSVIFNVYGDAKELQRVLKAKPKFLSGFLGYVRHAGKTGNSSYIESSPITAEYKEKLYELVNRAIETVSATKRSDVLLAFLATLFVVAIIACLATGIYISVINSGSWNLYRRRRLRITSMTATSWTPIERNFESGSNCRDNYYVSDV